MYVIKLPNGNLMVPESAMSADGRVMGDAYVEIGPGDTDYPRLIGQALTEQEIEERRRGWRDGDAVLQREFDEFLARRGGVDGGNGAS